MGNIKPSRGYCLIEPIEADEVSAGGVLLPERIKDLPQKGKVLAVGKGKALPWADKEMGLGLVPVYEEPEVKIGDTVIFKRFVDNRIKEDGKELLLVSFQDILGVYE